MGLDEVLNEFEVLGQSIDLVLVQPLVHLDYVTLSEDLEALDGRPARLHTALGPGQDTGAHRTWLACCRTHKDK